MTELYIVRVFDFSLGTPIKMGVFEDLEEIEKIKPQLSHYGREFNIVEIGLNSKQTNAICITKIEVNKLY